MKKLFILSLLLALTSYSLPAQNGDEQKTRGPFTWGLSGGANYSLLDIDSIDADPVILPFLGFHFGYRVNPKIRTYAILQLSTRGADNLSPVYKFRNQYADIKLLAQYQLVKGVDVLAGVQYSALLDSYYRTSGYSYFSNLVNYSTSGFKSEAEILAGISFEPINDVQITLEYTLPLGYLDYSNFQAGLRIDLAHFSRGKKMKKYTSLEHALDNPKKVEKLVLHRQNLDSLPSEIGKLENLRYLVLDGNKLETLPPEIGQLKELRYLSVKFNDLKTLPASIGNLTKLEELDLDHNDLRRIPETIGNLKEMRFLTIGKNNLATLPIRLWELEYLVRLDIAQSGVMLEIPPDIQQLQYLEILRIDKTTLMPYPAKSINPRLNVIVEQ